MSIMLFVILLHLLVARAINTRVESPPRHTLGLSYRLLGSAIASRAQLSPLGRLAPHRPPRGLNIGASRPIGRLAV